MICINSKVWMTAGFLWVCWSQAFELFPLLGTSTLREEENKVCNEHKILAQYHDSQYHLGFFFLCSSPFSHWMASVHRIPVFSIHISFGNHTPVEKKMLIQKLTTFHWQGEYDFSYLHWRPQLRSLWWKQLHRSIRDVFLHANGLIGNFKEKV